MAGRDADQLRRARSGARYPRLSELSLDRRLFLAGLGAAVLGACTEDDGVQFVDASGVIFVDGGVDAPVADADDGLDGGPDDGGPDDGGPDDGGPDDGGPDDGAPDDGSPPDGDL